MLIERLLLRWLYRFDPIYSLLLTFGVALVLQGLFVNYFNVSGTPYPGQPELLRGVVNLGFMVFPKFRLFVIVFSILVCLAVWFVIERTRIGALLRAGTENPDLVKAFGINVPRMVTLTFGFGTGLAGLAGVLAAPIYSVSPLMGADLIIVVFAVVVIGGMGSIMGAVVSGFALGLIEGVTKVFYAPAASTVIFLLMVVVLLVRPAGPVRASGMRRRGDRKPSPTAGEFEGADPARGLGAQPRRAGGDVGRLDRLRPRRAGFPLSRSSSCSFCASRCSPAPSTC